MNSSLQVFADRHGRRFHWIHSSTPVGSDRSAKIEREKEKKRLMIMIGCLYDLLRFLLNEPWKRLLQLIFKAFRAAICCRPLDCNDDHVATWPRAMLNPATIVRPSESFFLFVRLFDFIGMSAAARPPTWFQRNELFPLHSAGFFLAVYLFRNRTLEWKCGGSLHFQFQFQAFADRWITRPSMKWRQLCERAWEFSERIVCEWNWTWTERRRWRCEDVRNLTLEAGLESGMLLAVGTKARGWAHFSATALMCFFVRANWWWSLSCLGVEQWNVEYAFGT